MISRRRFIDSVVMTAAAWSAKSYGQILGANDRVSVAIIGTNSRATAHLASLKANATSARITHLCDVDSRNLGKFAAKARNVLEYSPATTSDFRNILDSRDVDAITIATPDHWHAPMAILGLRAGKHVYVEKPSSHNPREGELLVAAQKKYGKVVQVGNQHRSSKHERLMVQKIHDGFIGQTYFAKAWYANNRPSMGIGKIVPIPTELDWDLWQGPAPRSEYKDNIHPYNWHWLRRFGTGEALNNGTHETDVCRWALGVGFPERVAAQGGRYQFKDDWEFYDTLVLTLKYADKMISWEGKSDQGMQYYGRDRGALIQGTTGSVILAHDGYEVYDWKGKKIDDYRVGKVFASNDLLGQDEMTNAHFANFLASIQSRDKPHSEISDINVSITSLQLANISYFVSRELELDATNGHIKNDREAMQMWGREYQKGWEPVV